MLITAHGWLVALLVLFLIGAFDVPCMFVLGLKHMGRKARIFRTFMFVTLFWIIVYAALFFLVPGMKAMLAGYTKYFMILAVVGAIVGLLVMRHHFEAIFDDEE